MDDPYNEFNQEEGIRRHPPCMGKGFSALPPIGVIAYSDFYNQPERRVWGDYWFKENLLKEFARAGYPVDSRYPKVLLHLFGEPLEDLPGHTYNILWLHSHPDRVNPEVLRKYHKIFCISKPFILKIRKMGFDAEFMMVPTNMTPVDCKKKYDIVFVGNTRQNKMRKIISDLGDCPHNVKIWGWGWKGLIPDKWHGGEYYENARLNELYASSRVTLNDHHEDMRREGFINPRVLDVLASGGSVVSDDVPGMNDLLADSVPTYRTPEELRAIVDACVRGPEGRVKTAESGRGIALQYSYASCCDRIIRHVSSISGTLFS